jgi:hypothetical protein
MADRLICTVFGLGTGCSWVVVALLCPSKKRQALWRNQSATHPYSSTSVTALPSFCSVNTTVFLFLCAIFEEGADVNFTANPTGDANILYWYNPLTFAASMKNLKVVQALIDAGAEVNGSSGEIHPLFAAVEFDQSCQAFAIVTIKILYNAGVNMR